jgi:hypothetical protein
LEHLLRYGGEFIRQPGGNVKFSLKNPEKKTTIKLEKFSRQLQHDVKISKLPGGLSKRYQPLQSFKRMFRTALTLNPFGNRQRDKTGGAYYMVHVTVGSEDWFFNACEY